MLQGASHSHPRRALIRAARAMAGTKDQQLAESPQRSNSGSSSNEVNLKGDKLASGPEHGGPVHTL